MHSVSHRRFTYEAEGVGFEPMFAIGYVPFMLIVSLLIIRRLQLHPIWRTYHLPGTTVFILVFVASAYLIWLTVSPILRYAVSIEVLPGVIISISIIIGSVRLRKSGVK